MAHLLLVRTVTLLQLVRTWTVARIYEETPVPSHRVGELTELRAVAPQLSRQLLLKYAASRSAYAC